MKWFHWLGVLVAIGVSVGVATYAVHAEEEAGPKWKIVVILDGPPGKQELTYGNQLSGVRWFATKDDCERVRKGDSNETAYNAALASVKKFAEKLKQQRVPISVTIECRPDNSV